MRSMVFLSSRTLLRSQLRARSSARAASVTGRGERPRRAGSVEAKCAARRGMSRGRSRSGGTRMTWMLMRWSRSSRKSPASAAASRSRWVAATIRAPTVIGSSAPRRMISPPSSTRSSLAWTPPGSSPISSRKSVPEVARSKAPRRAFRAPVNAPRSCPNRSLSTRPSAMPPQLTATKASPCRRLRRCSSLATSSLPVPLSPSTRTALGMSASLSIAAPTSIIAALSPISGDDSAAPRSSSPSRWRRSVCRSARRTSCTTRSIGSALSMKLKAPRRTASTQRSKLPVPV